MKATKYIVIGTHSHEQNSWIPDGDIRHVCSCHNTEHAASLACEKAYYDLGGCDGSNMLSQVMVRFAKIGSKKARVYTEAEHGSEEHWANTYEHAGWLYLEVSFWDRAKIVAAPGGLGYAFR